MGGDHAKSFQSYMNEPGSKPDANSSSPPEGDYQQYMKEYGSDYSKYTKNGQSDYMNYMEQYAGDYQNYMGQSKSSSPVEMVAEDDSQVTSAAQDSASVSRVAPSSKSSLVDAPQSGSVNDHADASLTTPVSLDAASVSLARQSSSSTPLVAVMALGICGVGFALVVGKRRKTSTPDGYTNLL